MCGVNLKDCIEELLKFTLQFSLGETLEFEIGLSKDFCSHLLQPQPCDLFPLSHFNDSLEGVPEYPLYKRLASALQESMTSGTFYRTYYKMAMISVEESLKQKESEWQKLVSEKGSEIVNILKTVDFELDVQEPFFSQLKDGLKTIEGRCAGGKYSRIGSGTLLLFNKCIVFEVQDVHWYPSFYNMLEAEGLANALPGVESLKDGVQIYRKFYTEEKERSSGVLAIGVSKAALQPYISMASVLSAYLSVAPLNIHRWGLNYEGVQRLLGLTSTKGTIEYALPPPRLSLLSSFMSPYKPNKEPKKHLNLCWYTNFPNHRHFVYEKGYAFHFVDRHFQNISIEVTSSTLTHGARALAKHVQRSSNKYWGAFDGTDPNKNKLALDVITHLVTNCCWLNVHTVPPHGEVFEIRVADGYGARWSKDGSKFIGFLEPYMEDGHSVGWKH